LSVGVVRGEEEERVPRATTPVLLQVGVPAAVQTRLS
jgi:hypothetical protein